MFHYNEDENSSTRPYINSDFLPSFFLDSDNSVNIIQRLLKSILLVPTIVIEGTVSQILYLGPSSRFTCFQNLCSQFFFYCFQIVAIK